MATPNHALTAAAASAVAVAAESLRPSLTPRSTLHQGLVTASTTMTGIAVGAAVGALVGAVRRRPATSHRGTIATLGAAAIAAATIAPRHLRAHGQAFEEWGPQSGRPAVGAGVGLVAGAAATAGVAAVMRQFGTVTRSASTRYGGHPILWRVGIGGVAGGALAFGTRIASRRVITDLAADGRAADAALTQAPDDPFVSGGPDSAVAYDTLSREGRRFVNWRVPAGEMDAAGVRDATEPIRVFVGVDSADTMQERVELAMSELERLGAFDKAHILAICPAGSGYANSVPVEALEFYSRGDVASVVIQYGVLPSMLSMGRVPEAAEMFRLLIDRIQERIASQAEDQVHPALHLYGESLGARIAEVAISLDPALVDTADARLSGITSVLFVGTPGGTQLRDTLAGNPQVVHVDRWQDLPTTAPEGCQFWFLDHDADPVTRFELPLARSRPHWLAAPARGRNIPHHMRWWPVVTWQQVLLDVAYATQAQSGVFRSVGHDYRADLPSLVAAAFTPEAAGRVSQVTMVLADREILRDRRLAAAEESDGAH